MQSYNCITLEQKTPLYMKRNIIITALVSCVALLAMCSFDATAKNPSAKKATNPTSTKTTSESYASANHQIIKKLTPSSQGSYNIYTCVIDGIERTYKLYLPENILPDAPLVFVLHGYGGSFNLDHVQINETADRHGFAVCYPQGSKDGRGNNCWNVGYPFQADMKVDDVSFLCTLAKHLQQQHSLSRRNTFCTGMSNGGEMCYLLAYDKQKSFAAVAPIAGLTMEWMPRHYTRTRPIPLFEIHGTEDRVSEWTGDLDNKGGWGAYIAVPDAVEYWVRRNRCANTESITLPLKSSDAHTVIAHKHTAGRRGTEVWLYEVVGGGHTWATKDIDTAEEIWLFFSRFVK